MKTHRPVRRSHRNPDDFAERMRRLAFMGSPATSEEVEEPPAPETTPSVEDVGHRRHDPSHLKVCSKCRAENRAARVVASPTKGKYSGSRFTSTRQGPGVSVIPSLIDYRTAHLETRQGRIYDVIRFLEVALRPTGNPNAPHLFDNRRTPEAAQAKIQEAKTLLGAATLLGREQFLRTIPYGMRVPQRLKDMEACFILNRMLLPWTPDQPVVTKTDPKGLKITTRLSIPEGYAPNTGGQEIAVVDFHERLMRMGDADRRLAFEQIVKDEEAARGLAEPYSYEKAQDSMERWYQLVGTGRRKKSRASTAKIAQQVYGVQWNWLSSDDQEDRARSIFLAWKDSLGSNLRLGNKRFVRQMIGLDGKPVFFLTELFDEAGITVTGRQSGQKVVLYPDLYDTYAQEIRDTANRYKQANDSAMRIPTVQVGQALSGMYEGLPAENLTPEQREVEETQQSRLSRFSQVLDDLYAPQKPGETQKEAASRQLHGKILSLHLGEITTPSGQPLLAEHPDLLRGFKSRFKSGGYKYQDSMTSRSYEHLIGYRYREKPGREDLHSAEPSERFHGPLGQQRAVTFMGKPTVVLPRGKNQRSDQFRINVDGREILAMGSTIDMRNDCPTCALIARKIQGLTPQIVHGIVENQFLLAEMKLQAPLE